jgi:PIN domain nuclease of toxin-antitoxin system
MGCHEVIVVDTHAWVWWIAERTQLSPKALNAISSNDLAISPMTIWEIAMLHDRGRLYLNSSPLEWIDKALASSGTIVLPISAKIAVLAGTLRSNDLRDPADRLIVAAALQHGVPLVTKDGLIRRSAVVETIW